MIYAALLDGLTRPRVNRDVVPGMDRLVWLEADCEEDVVGERIEETNEAMLDAGELEVAPWPEPLTRQAWVDATDRYGLLTFRLVAWENITEEGHLVDGPRQVLHLSPVGTEGINASESIPWKAGLTVEQTRAAEPDNPTDWIRLPIENEGSNCSLGQAIKVIWHEVPTPAATCLQLADNDQFAPFDLSHPERYVVYLDSDASDSGTAKPAGNLSVQELLALVDGGTYTLYLRARRWRWYVVVVAHYVYIDPFFEWPVDEFFLSVFWDRPPFWPIRHDVAYTQLTGAYQLFNFWDQPRSYDPGIAQKWSLSRAAAQMSHEIAMQQWWSLCTAYVFLGNEWPDITIERDSPRDREVVLGVGRVDQATGTETRLWLMQNRDLSAVYPKQFIAAYMADWSATV